MQTEYINCTEIEAIAYDMMISGKDSDAVSVLRLWKAKPVQDFNMKLFSQGEYYKAMSEDNDGRPHHQSALSGRQSRGRQVAQAQTAVFPLLGIHTEHCIRPQTQIRRSERAAQTCCHSPERHPPRDGHTRADEGARGRKLLQLDEAWAITTATCAYTNHTVLAEALETGRKILCAGRSPAYTP